MKWYCMYDGCQNFVNIDLPLVKGATFTCRNHTIPGPDEVRFQAYQYDHDMARANNKIFEEKRPELELDLDCWDES